MDFDHEVRKHEGDAVDVSSTLGHGRGFVASVKSKHSRDHLRLSLKKSKVVPHGKTHQHRKPKSSPKRIAKVKRSVKRHRRV